jgi:environmental stress-induced protein Ves
MPLHSPSEITVSTSIAPNAWRVQPWKNGRGTTSEVIRVPDAADYHVRLSVAEVIESGPFSIFPGYTRWSLLLAGGPIWLNDEPLAGLVEFPGDLPIEARLAAPAALLNILGRGIAIREDADIVFDVATRVTTVRDPRGQSVWVKR